MQVFAVFDVSNPEWMKKHLSTQYPDDHFFSEPSTFFIAVRGKTTRQLGDEIGFDGSHDIRGIIVPVTSFWGIHNRDLWEWISVKMNANG